MIFDLHNDLLTDTNFDSISGSELLQKSLKNSLHGVVLAIWATRLDLSRELIDQLISPYLTPKMPKNICFSIEDCNFGHDIDLNYIADLPIDIYGIVWNDGNIFCGSIDSSCGLTTRGKQLLESLHFANKIVDTAHMNRMAFFDTIDIFDGPLMCSHTCMDSVHSHVRNLTDEQAGLLIQRGGLVGLTLVDTFVGGTGLDDFIRHIEHFAGRFGWQQLAIGTDYHGSDRILVQLSTYDSFDLLHQRLDKLGYPKAAIDGIMFSNAAQWLADKIQRED